MIDEVRIPRVVIGGLQSGSGKTTVALGLAAALAARGRVVQTFKVGPDLLDSAYLAHVSRRPCRNLDTWMLTEAGVRRALADGAHGADCAIVEGATGLFDGHGLRPDDRSPTSYPFPGSTAEVARVIRAPVLLVLDVAAMGETAAAVALGVRQLDPALRLVGVILDNVTSDYDRRLIEDAVWNFATVPVLGALPSIEAIGIPEWRLGLVPLAENSRVDEAIRHLAKAIARHCDLDLIERLMGAAEPVPVASRLRAGGPADTVRLGVAFDDAFASYYPENLELLEEAGAVIVPFSPLEDRSLPDGLDGLYLGGGFSEVFAERLSRNRAMVEALQRARAHGMPVYAESGGMLYAARSVRTPDGAVLSMAGLVAVDVALDHARPRAGYRELRLQSDCLLGAAGTRLRGHEYHAASVVGGTAGLRPAYSMHDCNGEPLGCEGWADQDLVGSLAHLHFAQDPQIAVRLVGALRAARARREGTAVPA